VFRADLDERVRIGAHGNAKIKIAVIEMENAARKPRQKHPGTAKKSITNEK